MYSDCEQVLNKMLIFFSLLSRDKNRESVLKFRIELKKNTQVIKVSTKIKILPKIGF